VTKLERYRGGVAPVTKELCFAGYFQAPQITGQFDILLNVALLPRRSDFRGAEELVDAVLSEETVPCYGYVRVESGFEHQGFYEGSGSNTRAGRRNEFDDSVEVAQGDQIIQ
jgi:hypothetical protein